MALTIPPHGPRATLAKAAQDCNCAGFLFAGIFSSYGKRNRQQRIEKRLERIEGLTVNCIDGACALVGLGFMAGLWAYLTFRNHLITLEEFGAFGSYLQGAVGSLWSLAWVLFIFAAFLAQKQQLIQQDAEL